MCVCVCVRVCIHAYMCQGVSICTTTSVCVQKCLLAFLLFFFGGLFECVGLADIT